MSLIYSAVQLLLSIAKKPRLLHLKYSALGLLLSVAIVFFLGVVFMTETPSDIAPVASEQVEATEADLATSQTRTRVEAAEQEEPEPAAAVVESAAGERVNPPPRPPQKPELVAAAQTPLPKEDKKQILPGQWARAFCNKADRTGLTSSRCEVGLWDREIRLSIDMVASEARLLCPDLVKMLKDAGAEFEPGWTIQIRSPYSSGQSIAFCRIS